MRGVTLYRDEAVVLRTQKLGEADRIITLLTRSHGRVRAVAKGVRRTTSRFGSRLEPFTHVDLQLAEGRTLDVVTQAETIDAVRATRSARDYERYTAGTAMLETAERLVAEEREPARPAVPAARRRAAGAGRRRSTARLGARLLPAALPGGRRLRPVVRRLRPLRRSRVRTAGSTRRPAACSARPAGCRARPARPPRPSCCSVRCWPGDWPVVHAAEPRHLREASGLVAAYLAVAPRARPASLAYVER